jgi:hypothetical protein
VIINADRRSAEVWVITTIPNVISAGLSTAIVARHEFSAISSKKVIVSGEVIADTFTRAHITREVIVQKVARYAPLSFQ